MRTVLFAAAAAWLALSACDLRAPQRTDDPAVASEIQQLTSALMANPSDLGKRWRLAELHLGAEHWFQAAELYKQLSELAPDDALALAGLSDAYVHLSYFSQAFEALSRGAALPKHPEECFIRLGLLLRADGSREGLVQADRMLRRFLEVAPDHPRAGEAREALQQLQAQLATTPADPRPAGTATSTAAERDIPEHAGAKGGEPVGALNKFGQAFGRALEAVRANDAPGAEKALLEALEDRPDDVGALALLSETYLVLKKPDEARNVASRAYKLDPRDSQARWAYGLAQVRTQGDVAAGLEAWRALVRDDPEFARQSGVTRALEEAEKQLAKP